MGGESPPSEVQAGTTQKSSEKANSDDDVEVPELARGRRLEEATCLRISRIEKALALKKDLTTEERRSLRSRKNTANFRERRKQAREQKHFLEVELEIVLNAVSSHYSGGLRTLEISQT